MSKLMTTMKNSTAKALGKCKQYSPEALIVLGITGMVVATVMACRATLKVEEIIDETKEHLDNVHKVASDPEMVEKYSPEDARKDTAIVYTRAAWKLVKLYGPSIAVGTVSIFAICKSHNILKQRNVALASAYAALDKGFRSYKERVAERFGEDVEKEIRYGVKAEEITRVIEENGKEKEVTETINIIDEYNLGPYSKCFDEGCYGWSKDAEQNLLFLKEQEQWANNQLRARGYLTLNQVYRALGIPETNAGMVIGWRYRPGDDAYHNFVDFGIYNIRRKANRDFVNGYERSIFLDFNVDGNIYGTI